MHDVKIQSETNKKNIMHVNYLFYFEAYYYMKIIIKLTKRKFIAHSHTKFGYILVPTNYRLTDIEY